MPGLAALKRMGGLTRVQPQQQIEEVATIPPPVGGWNARDTLPLMDIKDAVILENFVPDTTDCHLRGGHTVHATINVAATAVETLIGYEPPNVTSRQLFAAIPSTIYNVTAAATASSTAAVVGTLTNGRWQYDQMTNTAGHWLMLANGADAPRLYDGTTWTTASVTASGLTTSNIIGVHNHANRMWLIEENKLRVWYLGTSAIAGEPTQFFPPFRRGGKVMAMGSWTRDGGAGPDDYAVFVSNRGECIIYSGFGPGSDLTWQLVGVFNIPNVIGRRCFIHAGAELGVLTVQGVMPLSQILGMTPGGAARSSFTDKISGFFKSQAMESGTAFGWEVIEYPRGNLLIANVPIVERSEQIQAVMNIHTGAWCKFTAMNAGCWGVLDQTLYFGGNDSKVYRYTDDVHLDGASSADIVGMVKSAYNTFGSPKTKLFNMARPLLLSPSGYSAPVSIQTNYDEAEPSVDIVAASTSGTQWDAGQWDAFQWAGGSTPTAGWQAVAGEGRAGAIAFGVSAAEEITYNGCDVGFVVGNFL